MKPTAGVNKKFSKAEKAKIALLSVRGIGCKTCRKILSLLKKRGLSLDEAWPSLSRDSLDWGLNTQQALQLLAFQKCWEPETYVESLLTKGIQIILADSDHDAKYPPLLREISDYPEMLLVRGSLEILQNLKMPIAVVGTRKATAYGKMVANKIGRELADLNAEVVSGFMYGVDTIAQKAAIAAGGRTVGVLGYGFDHCFPASHRYLMEEMLATQQAVFVTEFSPEVEAKSGNFPQRNRIVAGMCWATVVVEAATESGSLITAELATDYGRDVMTVPGPITSPYSDGTKNLINTGATLVSSGWEIIAEVRGERVGFVHGRDLDATDQSCACCLTQSQFHLLKKIKERSLGITTENLLQITKLTPSQLQTELTWLELAHKIRIEGELVSIS